MFYNIRCLAIQDHYDMKSFMMLPLTPNEISDGSNLILGVKKNVKLLCNTI